MNALKKEPGMSGFVVPEEEAPHTRTWMCWPSYTEHYRYGGRPVEYPHQVRSAIGRLAAAIAENEPVIMCAGPEHQATARSYCGDKVELVSIPTDDMWVRDSGPVFVQNEHGEKAGVNLNFNAWGGKENLPVDAKLAGRILEHLGVPQIKASIVGEGGGIEFDGEGTLLLTESCWVNDNRNPGRTRQEIGAELSRVFGIKHVVWLKGVAGEEETDGHIDGYVRLLRPGLVLMSGANRNDPVWGGDTIWHRDYEDAKDRLRKARDAAGRRFEIVELPWATKFRSRDPNFFTSYANFYVGNGAVYSPQFGDDKADNKAESTLAELFPERQVIMLEVDRIYENGGGIHCVTQQEC